VVAAVGEPARRCGVRWQIGAPRSLVLSQPVIGLPAPSLERRARQASLRRHVALAVPMGSRRFHEIVRGITDWAVRHGNWSLTTFCGADGGDCLERLADWRGGDGVIAAVQTEADARIVADVGIPCVNLSSSVAGSDLPRVAVDNEAVGRIAAEHLLACGFRRFAYYGPRGVRFSHQREAGFGRHLEAKGFVADAWAAPARKGAAGGSAGDDAELISLCASLRRSERPLAVFAANDQLAKNVLSACAELSLRVPEQVAVLGVDDDVLICEQTAPALSSIACDWRGVGYQAAAMLDQLMGFEPAEARHHLVQPVGLMRRASTDIALGPSTSVATAVAFVRGHIHEVFGVEALLRVTRVPRRSLELEFRRSMGCTPYQFITRARVARAKELLSAPKPQKLSAVAAACGFADLRRFRLVFRRETGMSPAEFRARGR
jgi:LacI family transcriptional regulator